MRKRATDEIDIYRKWNWDQAAYGICKYIHIYQIYSYKTWYAKRWAKLCLKSIFIDISYKLKEL